jgi:type II secretory pathway pseudopilin PulG
MKTPSSSCRDAFTLLELFVVIGVLVILVVLILGAIPGEERPSKSVDKNIVQTITVALNAYYTEYGKFPTVEDLSTPNPPGGVKDTVYGDPSYGAKASNNILFFALRNIRKGTNQDGSLNPRKVVFLDVRSADFSRSNEPRSGFFDKTAQGGVPDADRDGCLYDSWGRQYGVILDMNGDERIDLEGFYRDFAGVDPQTGKAPRKRVGAFSVGKDGKLGKDGDKVFRNEQPRLSDDVLSFD